MPRYFFHIFDDGGTVPDDEGMDCPDDGAAKREGEASARELLRTVISSHGAVDDRRIEITDKKGRPVATVLLRDLIH
jgi:hypothetical protein